jgi:hypothetical protein
MMEKCQNGVTRAELTISTKHTFKNNECSNVYMQVKLT